MRQPTLTTEHLQLRPLQAQDVTDVCTLLNSAPDISAMTMLIPYPCPRETVVSWIADLQGNWEQRKGVAYAICLSQSQQLIGSISLVSLETDQPEIGYWLGADFRQRGFGTEASLALCQFAFSQLHVEKIYGCHLPQNVASGRVLLKCGFHSLGMRHVFLASRQRQETVAVYMMPSPAMATA
ncbi:GNAT family N-acetyltransferase [Dickeya fangzhongdai]|uniref:GNAT family N-acetyltransferase n=1 Tax=Dickeya fangzhongdai TaxID=1778540 RepID=UPI0004F5B81A|nr:GNAT family N-acetyltransferase [Dickeya fangzhongdai]AIR69258.1 acetyltransferase [Dickeya fangzhongdai]KGT97037.1 acetyltransferase [Dickeya fangzhongdai]KHN56055.1 acetyltransferase [Dickeya fangzhongdai]